MANFYQDNEDLRFYVERYIDWAPVVELTERFYKQPDGFKDHGEAKEFYQDILNLIGEFIADEVAPHAAQIDREGVNYKDGEAHFPERLQSIFEQINALELHGMCLPRELGGQNCPLTLFYLANEVMGRGDISVMAHHSFHGAMALAMLVYSIREGSTEFNPEDGTIIKTRFADEIGEIVRGEAWGAMDITEPDAGSDMAKLRAVGEQDEDGNWFVTGQKIFITSGHGKHHFVIARTEKTQDEDDAFAGLGGLSMFLVKTYEGDGEARKRIVSLDRLEEKLGHHGSATASLTFERAPAQLIGKRGEGFKYMLLLMNNARIGVGFECLGLCESALRTSRAYAQERRTMGKSIDQHEMIADYLDEMESDIQGLRALAVTCAVGEELAQKSEVMLKSGAAGDAQARCEQLQDRYKHRARRLTPLLKYLAAEKAVEMSRRCVQIHGGVGYTTEYGAEKLLRDAMVMPIYEGTSQIQSLMVMKDTLQSALKSPSRFAQRIAQANLKARYARDPLEKRVAKIQALALSSQQHLLSKTVADKYRSLKGKPLGEWPERFMKNWDPKRDFAYAMLHAERLTQQLADEAICEVLLEQVKQFSDRRWILERYLERAEPRARMLNDQIINTGQRLLDQLEARRAQDEQRKAG